ncbi:hypothetical protein B4U80_14107 [Leptotrombidium deliense]|uniref:NTR domain-containing protein n=1 Tax=Leptotrombidium deliense TaxID=299467 RepID=A0A443S2L2_9ACAR|nr:hypothetical protein B4U80_14107 [Leptotrombidium deliense]
MKYTVISLFLTTLICDVHCCECSNKTNAEKFCDAKTVIHFKVKQQDTEFGDDYYQIKVKHVYKGDDSLSLITTLVTPSIDSKCGVALDVGSQYVMEVEEYLQILEANYCNFLENWRNIRDSVMIIN